MKANEVNKEITNRVAAFFGKNGFATTKGNLWRLHKSDGIDIGLEFGVAQRQGHVYLEPLLSVYWRQFATAFYEFECEQRQQYQLTKPTRNHPILIMQFRSLVQPGPGKVADTLCVSDFRDLDHVSGFLIATYGQLVLAASDILSTPQGMLDWSAEHNQTTGAWGAFARVLLIEAVDGADAAHGWARARLEKPLTPFEAECLRFLLKRMPAH